MFLLMMTYSFQMNYNHKISFVYEIDYYMVEKK